MTKTVYYIDGASITWFTLCKTPELAWEDWAKAMQEKYQDSLTISSLRYEGGHVKHVENIVHKTGFWIFKNTKRKYSFDDISGDTVWEFLGHHLKHYPDILMESFPLKTVRTNKGNFYLNKAVLTSSEREEKPFKSEPKASHTPHNPFNDILPRFRCNGDLVVDSLYKVSKESLEVNEDAKAEGRPTKDDKLATVKFKRKKRKTNVKK